MGSCCLWFAPVTCSLPPEWDSGRLGALYDKSAWESPPADASELEARKQQCSPAKVTLADCLRVSREPSWVDGEEKVLC